MVNWRIELHLGEPIPPMDGVNVMPLFYDLQDGSAIQTNQWKLVRSGRWSDQKTVEWQLYDMQTDRTETTNRAGVESEITNRLRPQWEEWAE